MKQTQEKIEVFVPARALEYFSNAECSNLSKKLKLAVCRYYLKGDFFVAESNEDSRVKVFLDRFVFNKEAIGYEVWAFIKSG